ncbi:DMT family transporter [Neobacillus mesonae]|uniref:DMT family transporter n=1 Tax=Neobacillus mesonae TaxID=1193713 RepID=UPI002041D0C1|nr:DMT family transporter [Neobacillus mesonae]MCM3569743.1 DMT family transporter [Neobacillus mesonae]
MTKRQKYQIYILLVFVMVTWGFNVIATKMLVTSFAPVTITSLRIFTAGISVFIILFFLKKVRIPSKHELFYIILAGLFNVVGHHFFLSIGLTKTSASNGGLILGLGPLLSTIIAFIILKYRVTVLKWLGIVFGLAGITFIVVIGNGGSLSAASMGDLYVFMSIFSQALSFVLIRKISHSLDPRLMTGYMLLFGSVILFFISLWKEPDGLQNIAHGSTSIWMVFLSSAIIATAIGHMIYNSAIGKVGVTESAIFINLNPFFALIGAVLFLGEKVTLSQVIGFIFILFGVLFGSGALEEYVRQNKLKRDLLFRTEKSKHI